MPTLSNCSLRVGGLLFVVLFLTSCATNSLRSAAEADLELRFYRWDSVCIAKPDTRENGFSRLFSAEDVVREVECLNPPRKLAAVVVGYSYDLLQVRQIAMQWHQRLARQGFERVVVMRGSDQWSIDKLPIVYDSAISSVHVTPDRAEQFAKASPAPGADAAHSPGAAVE